MSDKITVAVIGAGAMGAGIAQVAAAANHPVLLYDACAGAAEGAVASVRAMFAKLATKGKMTPEAAAAAGARLEAVDGLDAMTPAGLVIEAVVEDLNVKRELVARIEALVAPDCLLATNTSSLSIPAIATALKSPQRLVGMHFFNPAPLMELVEVVGGVASDADCLARIEALARAWGKTPVRARSTPGFIVNRVARPFYAEGLRLVAEGAATPATLDAVMRESGGFRMGPCELTDLIGQDVNFAVTSSVFRAFYGDPRFAPSLVQQELVEAGWLGRKTGRGFFQYGENAVAPAPETEPAAPAPELITLGGCGAFIEAMAARLAASPAAQDIRVVRAAADQAWIEVGDVVLTQSDGRTAAQRSFEWRSVGSGLRGPRADASISGAPGGEPGWGPRPSIEWRSVGSGLRGPRADASISGAPGGEPGWGPRPSIESGPHELVLVDLALDYAKATRLGVARSPQCSEASYRAAVGALQAAGFAVSRLGDLPGLAVWRTVAMLANEAADAVHYGVANAADVDTAMRKGVNYPLGPLAWAERLGIARVREVLTQLAEFYGEDRYRTSPLLRQMEWSGGRFHE